MKITVNGREYELYSTHEIEEGLVIAIYENGIIVREPESIKIIDYIINCLREPETTTITVTMDGETETDFYICNKCGEQFSTVKYRPYFCPNCGAKIEGSDKA